MGLKKNMLSCKQAFLGRSGSRAKRERELAVTSQELNSVSVSPVAKAIDRAVSFGQLAWSGNMRRMLTNIETVCER